MGMLRAYIYVDSFESCAYDDFGQSASIYKVVYLQLSEYVQALLERCYHVFRRFPNCKPGCRFALLYKAKLFLLMN